MAAPTATTRGAVGGSMMINGWPAKITFSTNPTIEFQEISVQPSAIDAGDPIDITTMHNLVYETFAPQCLERWGDIVVVAGYDAAVLTEIQALIGITQGVTTAYPDGTTVAAWGYLRRAEPGTLVKNGMPQITLTIVITNYDPVNCVEAGPVLVAGTGSCLAC